jgi:SAM-dependent methyltransferase
MQSFTSPLIAPSDPRARGLLITHRGQRCGVWQFGARLHRALVAGGGIDWHYAECADLPEFQAAAAATKPDVVLANFHPSTLPWAAAGLPSEGAVTFAVFHEASQASVAALRDRPFDVFLCPDPTLLPYDPAALPVPRFIPTPLGDLPPAPEVFTVGSFGFATHGKGFEKLCALVDAQCIKARIRINIPPHDDPTMASPARTAQIVDACRAAVTRPGVTLEITHDFFDEGALLDFLAANSLNAFLYDDAPGRGISSCTDYALAAGRPIAVTRTSMFRHLTGINPSICVEDRPLVAIAAGGTDTLQFYRSAYTEAAAGAAWNATMLDALATRRAARAVPDGRGFNKLLDDRARSAYTGPLEDLRRLAPGMLSKVERTNIQQAFALDAVRRFALRFAAPRILVIGSYEDTACASLRALGYQLEEVDPQVNGRDLEAFYRAPTSGAAFDLILCVSVLEHVVDDQSFVRQAAALLAPGGIAIFTVDFSERYPETRLRPAADQRLYTQHDLRTRLMEVIPDCALIDPPNWSDGAEDFEYEDCRYAFATWVFTRLRPAFARHAELTERKLGGAPWKALAAADRVSHEREVSAVRDELAASRASHEREVSAVRDELAASRAAYEREIIALRATHAAEIAALTGKLAHAESTIDYVAQQHLLERALFRHDGRPVKPLRRLLFHTSGKPRRLFRRIVLHRDATPRYIFGRWAQNQTFFVRAATHCSGRLTTEQDGERNRVPDGLWERETPLAPPLRAARGGFARRMEKRVLRPILHGLRSVLTGRRVNRRPRPEQREGLHSLPASQPASPLAQPSSPPALQHDVLSEMRRLAAEMEKALLTLAMERGTNAWPNAAPARPEPASEDSGSTEAINSSALHSG